LQDLGRLIPLVAAIDDPASALLASALQYWRQNPDASFDTAINIQPDGRRRDLIRRRDSALRRVMGKMRFRSVADAAVLIAKYVEVFKERAPEAGQASADLQEIADCGGVPGISQLRQILGRGKKISH
jgi:hypothetical protein